MMEVEDFWKSRCHDEDDGFRRNLHKRLKALSVDFS